MMVRSLIVLVGLAAFLTTAPARAQQVVLNRLYGDGVHAFFSGDYRQAYEQLSAAINGGTQDPRAFYFRGLAYLKLGRPQEGAIDFQRGAELETRDVNRRFNVAKALERVQGEARSQVEAYRVVARKSALEASNRVRQSRFEALKREEQRVLQSQIEAAKAPVEVVATPPGTVEENVGVRRPSGQTSTEDKAVAQKEDNPFKPGGEEKPKADKANPFEEGAAAATNPPAKAAGKKGIFGALRGAVDKSLSGGGKPPVGTPPPSLPFGLGEGLIPSGPPEKPKTPPPADSSPFEEPKPAPPKAAPTEKKPPAEAPAEDNPFKEDAPAEKKAPEKESDKKSETNPFGG